MERFTKKAESGSVLELWFGGVPPWTVAKGDGFNYPRYTISGCAIDRLAAYEGTGLMPGDVVQISNLLRLVGEDFNCRLVFVAQALVKYAEYTKAESEGRLVVLPCKVGQTVYVAGKGKVVECSIDEAYLDNNKGPEFLVSFRCEFPEEDSGVACRGCPFNNWKQDYSGEWGCDGEWGQASIKGVDFGKTVFLTREEAEAALQDVTDINVGNKPVTNRNGLERNGHE